MRSCFGVFDTVHEFYHIFYHEVGHYVFMHTLTQADRDVWMYDVRKNEKVTVSTYACTNSKEDFSECYASWFSQPDVLRRCPMRYRFLVDRVFRVKSGEKCGVTRWKEGLGRAAAVSRLSGVSAAVRWRGSVVRYAGFSHAKMWVAVALGSLRRESGERRVRKPLRAGRARRWREE